jgi:hypothetical protein
LREGRFTTKSKKSKKEKKGPQITGRDLADGADFWRGVLLALRGIGA